MSLQSNALHTPSTKGRRLSLAGLIPAVVAAVLGCSFVYASGFAERAELHNAAHDGRHSAGFPCH
jgi:cobalt transporter subunit CbtB